MKKLEKSEFDDFYKSSSIIPSNNPHRKMSDAQVMEEQKKIHIIDVEGEDEMNFGEIKKMNDIANKKTNAGYEENELLKT